MVMARTVYWANLRTAVIFERGLTGKGSFRILLEGKQRAENWEE